LDPQLELNNKDLTNNWGMTHTRMGNRPSQRKTWAMKQAESSNSSQSNSQNNQHLMMQQGSPAINSNNTSSTSDPLGSMQPLNVAAGDGGTFHSTPENNERMGGWVMNDTIWAESRGCSCLNKKTMHAQPKMQNSFLTHFLFYMPF
jgi:hypothetical protein